MARDSKVGISLEATNRASGTIDQVKKSLGGLEGAAGVAAKGMAALGGAAIVGGIVSLGTRAAGAAVEMAQLAAQSQMVGNAMEGLAAGFGQSSDAMLGALKRASNGTIAEYDLMLGANKAMMLGVAQNAQELEGIMKVALTRGAAMGLSTTQAFDNLVTGLGRGSALILDNLGITMQQLTAAEAEYAESIGKTTSQLTEQEKKQGMVNAVLKEAAGVDMSNVEGMASSFAQAQASIADMKSALGELFGPAIAAVAKDIADAVAGVNDALDARQLDAAKQEIWEFGAGIDEALQNLKRYRNEEALGLTGMSADIDLAMVRDTIAITEKELQRLGRAWNETSQITGGPLLDLDALAQGVVAFQNMGATLREVQAAAQAAGPAFQSTLDAVGVGSAKADAALGALGVQAGKLLTEVSGRDKWDGFIAGAEASATKADSLRTAAGAAAVEIAKVGSAASGAVGGLAALAQQAAVAEQALWNIENAARAAQAAMLATAISSLKSTALQAAGTLGVNEAMQEYETNARTLSQVGGYLAKSGMDTTEVQFNLEAMTQRMNSATLDQVRALEAEQAALARTTGSGGSSGGLKGYASALRDASLAGQEFTYTLNGLQSQVQGALSGALNLDVGVNVEDFLPREDAINENARRLADIMVNGFKGQDWMAEFAAEAPDVFAALQESSDPQGAAAQMLRDFQDGLLPGLIDKGAVKEKVKRAILGDASMSQLASEITAELAAEMGQNPAQVAGLVNQAMGRGAADASIDGQVITQLKSQTFLNSVNKAGSDAGASWGQWFLTTVGDNVPGQLLDILAVLVAPIVAQRNAAQATRTGAN